MIEQVEISSFDLRYEGFRMKSKNAEKELCVSILGNGIRDPLQGVDKKEGDRILLNGFKRYRCAKKLGIGIVPYISLGSDEAIGIIELIRIANAKSLSILEQAKLIDELKVTYKMTHSEIADHLEKSRAWVSVRAGIIGEMSESVLTRIFNGGFPVYSYMYTLRQFMRINRISKEEIDDFVCSVSDKGLSIRDIEILAHGYFKGSEKFREQIKSGNIAWTLGRLKETTAEVPDCTKIERRMLKDLEITQKYMQRILSGSRDTRYRSGSFFAQANLLSGGILRQLGFFSKAIKDFYDRTGQTESDLSS